MISIHMTTHRRYASGLLQRAIDSVLSQDFQDFEFIICDDASSDGTAAYLDQVAKLDGRVRIVRNEKNVNSVAISLGRCFQASDATRPWVSWMFDDCRLMPGALKRLVEGLQGNPSTQMLYGITEVHLKSGEILRVGAPSCEARSRINESAILVPNGGILIHRNLFGDFGWYDTSVILRRSCDWDLFRRLICGGTNFLVLPDVMMQEFGDIQPDSLRNAFTTSFDLMVRFAAARDASGARFDVENMLARPVDWIPPGAWSSQDLNQMRYMFTEYFLSVGEISRAYRWSRLLAESLTTGILLRENLLRIVETSKKVEQRAMATGAFAATVMGAWREEMRNA